MAIRKSIKLGFVAGIVKAEPVAVIGATTFTKRGQPANEYIVQEVINSTAYQPGQVLTEANVTELCNKHDWTVRIVPSKAVS